MAKPEFLETVTNEAEGQSHWLNRESYVPAAVDTLRKIYEDLSYLKVLDAGCGQGHDIAKFQEITNKVFGIDNNFKLVKVGKKMFPGVDITIGDVESMPFLSNSFNVVLCLNVIFYTDFLKSLPEITRVLEPGGIAFLSLDEKIEDLNNGSDLHLAKYDEMIEALGEIDNNKR